MAIYPKFDIDAANLASKLPEGLRKPAGGLIEFLLQATGAEDPANVMPAPMGMAAIPLWHGSPSFFRKFKYIPGSRGELAGPGIYNAESQSVARGFRPPISLAFKSLDEHGLHDPRNMMLTDIMDDLKSVNRDDIFTRIKEIVSRHQGTKPSPYTGTLKMLEAGEPIVKSTRGGFLYKTALDADPDKILQLDRPLTEQTAFVKKALQDVPERSMRGHTNRGIDAVNDLLRRPVTSSPLEAKQQLLKELSDRGIHGGRIPQDRLSNNYVAYDPDRLMIEEIFNSFDKKMGRK